MKSPSKFGSVTPVSKSTPETSPEAPPIYFETSSNVLNKTNNLPKTEFSVLERPGAEILAYDHVSFYVGSAKNTAVYMCKLFGFTPYCYANLETGSRSLSRYAVKNGDIVFEFISGIKPIDPMTWHDLDPKNFNDDDDWQLKEVYKHLQDHGDSVKNVAFKVKDVMKVLNQAVQRTGCKVILEPKTYSDRFGHCTIAAIQGINDTIHVLVDRDGYKGFLPGCHYKYFEIVDEVDPDEYYMYNLQHDKYKKYYNFNKIDPETGRPTIDFPSFEEFETDEKDPKVALLLYNQLKSLVYKEFDNRYLHTPNVGNKSDKVELMRIDHCVQNVNWHEMDSCAEFYAKAFGFHLFWSVDEKQVHTQYSALKSTVMASGNELVKMPINEPAKGLKTSQIEEFLEFNLGPGVQHIALQTNDIVHTILSLKRRGVEFINVPDLYYKNIIKRLATEDGPGIEGIEESLSTLQALGILIDFDENGYLLQLFTKPLFDRPTVFIEIIQRHNHNGFGAGNFKGLFQVLEKDQELRGNLSDQITPDDFDLDEFIAKAQEGISK